MAYGKFFCHFVRHSVLVSWVLFVIFIILFFYFFLEYSCTNYASPSDATPVVRQRHFYTESQLEHLEADFAVQQFPNQERRHRLAVKIGVSDKSILVCSFLKFFSLRNVRRCLSIILYFSGGSRIDDDELVGQETSSLSILSSPVNDNGGLLTLFSVLALLRMKVLISYNVIYTVSFIITFLNVILIYLSFFAL